MFFSLSEFCSSGRWNFFQWKKKGNQWKFCVRGHPCTKPLNMGENFKMQNLFGWWTRMSDPEIYLFRIIKRKNPVSFFFFFFFYNPENHDHINVQLWQRRVDTSRHYCRFINRSRLLRNPRYSHARCVAYPNAWTKALLSN